jgi:hypothetical protein
MLAMSTLMMPAPTMALGGPPLVATHKPPETKLLAIHPTHAQPQTTPQHQLQSSQQQNMQQQSMQQQQNMQQQNMQQQQQSNMTKPGKISLNPSM